MHAEPVGLDAQWPSSRLSAAGAGVQEARPQYADAGTSPFADGQDQEVKALVSKCSDRSKNAGQPIPKFLWRGMRHLPETRV